VGFSIKGKCPQLAIKAVVTEVELIKLFLTANALLPAALFIVKVSGITSVPPWMSLTGTVIFERDAIIFILPAPYLIPKFEFINVLTEIPFRMVFSVEELRFNREKLADVPFSLP
jgi:hypothetical protein